MSFQTRQWGLSVVLAAGALSASLLGADGLYAQASAPASAPAAPTFDIPKIPYERFKLPNGLTVLVSEDHSVPIVSLTVWYHVGSKNEKPGRTGFAHLFEHVMFQGSQNVGNDMHFKTIEEAGGDLNGSTTEDRTNYYETVPSSEFETIVWLEADRMGFLLPTLDLGKLDEQRSVVKNERRQRTDNQVFGTSPEAISRTLYPESNPYSWPVIGYMKDLDAASLDDVKEFFRQYYAPTNATLVIAGDVTVARAKELVTKYFGPIPAGPAIERPAIAPVTLGAEKRLILEDSRATLPRLQMVWPTVKSNHPDMAAIDALAWLLTGNRTARLTKLLSYDRQVVTGVGAYQSNNEGSGEFSVSASPRQGVALTDLEKLIDSVLASVQANPFTQAELDRYRALVRVNAVMGLSQNIAKAETLASGEVFSNNPLSYIDETKASLAVTLADVQRVAKQYLTPGRIVLSLVPAGQAAQASKPELPSTNVTPTPEK